MSGIKRTLRSIFYRVDQVVGEMENHDALIEAAIREQQKKLSAARLECNRIIKQSEKTRGQVRELTARRDKWQARAINEAPNDEERALACLQQRENLDEQIIRLRQMDSQYESANQKLREDIRRAETELVALKQKHQLMRARQSTADALGKFGDVGETRLDEVESSFDRWELKISQGELNANESFIDSDADGLECVYVKEESQAELKIKLKALLESENSNDAEEETNHGSH